MNKIHGMKTTTLAKRQWLRHLLISSRRSSFLSPGYVSNALDGHSHTLTLLDTHTPALPHLHTHIRTHRPLSSVTRLPSPEAAE